MGNLHEGHLSLVRLAKTLAERVVVSVFVNPTQFGAGEDFDSYPRTLPEDTQKLSDESIDLLFAPDVQAIYPFGVANATRVSVPGLTDEFCGAGRPGHFDGVSSVVMRLFALIQPDVAVFGQKDYQQQLVIRRMVEDIGLPIEVTTGAVVRETNGLAMSSRNSYLSDEDRETAAGLYRVLQQTGDRLQGGREDYAALATEALTGLENAGLQPEYFAIRNSTDLSIPDSTCHEFVILVGARVGGVRLIDNVIVKLE
jgi:pantoate--beta-alanine ligase